MAEITELTELTSVADDDEFVVFDVSVGSGNSKKATRENILQGVAREGGDHDFGTSEIEDLTTQNSTLGFTDGATLTKMLHGLVSPAPGSASAGTSITVTATVTGAETTDQLCWALTGPLPDGLTCQAWISAANTVSFKFHNTTAGSITGATYGARVTVMRFA